MAEKVKINIDVVIYDEKGNEIEEERFTSEYDGLHMLNDGMHYIKYEEPCPDNKEIVINTIRCDGDGVRLSRKGSTHYTMNFIKREKNEAKYVTPYGVFDMSNHMHEYLLAESENRIAVVMDYDLFMDGGFVHRRKMRIEVDSI